MVSATADIRARVDALGTILGIWAHPDDETYLSAGIMATAVDAGARVVCVTATRGEAGSLDHERWPPASLAAVRTAEMDVALRILGVTEHHWLDYPDGGCAAIDDDEAVGRIAAILAEVQPDTVLTFAPDGMTGHEDHQSVCRWTTLAVAGMPVRPALHYATVTPAHWADMEALFFGMGVSMGGRPDVTPDADCSILVDLPPDLLARKQAAVRAQVSQTELLIAGAGDDAFESLIRREMFRLAAVSG